MAAMMLAEMGATVLRIDRMTESGLGIPLGTKFELLKRSRHVIQLDLKRAEAIELTLRLIGQADALIEGFRPRVMERLGLGPEVCLARNPRLVFGRVTGWGQDGPLAHAAGHDLNYIGDSGLLALSMGDPAHPVVPPALIADIAGGAYPAVMNIMFALMQRQRSGRGCKLDIAMTDNLFPFMYWAIGDGLAAGEWPGNGTAMVCGGTPRYRLYPASDGKVVAAAPIEQKFWEEFCELIGLDKELGGIGERLIPGKPSRIGMAMRAYQREAPDLLVKLPGYFSSARHGGKQTVWMDQHGSETTLVASHRRR